MPKTTMVYHPALKMLEKLIDPFNDGATQVSPEAFGVLCSARVKFEELVRASEKALRLLERANLGDSLTAIELRRALEGRGDGR